MKRLTIAALEAVCAGLDRVPTWERHDDGLRRFYGGWGCRLGIARLAAELDERWGTGVWGPA